MATKQIKTWVANTWVKLLQTTGQSTNKAMSQKAVTDSLDSLKSDLINQIYPIGAIYISLNSTNNIDNFISEENMDKTYWIMVDNDDAGDVFVEKLQKSSISSIDCRYMFKNYNDVNDSIRAFKENKKKEHKNEQ